ncbi:MAG: hypothetical protein PWP23_2651 [Candidatus Sumerlaeota bacterium]|nr:hypothetical protein [Candidatus Sumerlaeota bacterium]
MTDLPPSRDTLPLGLGLRAWLGVLAAVTLVRLLVAATYPVYETEAYYWLWSRHLAAGYFDHPPMLGWLCWLTDWWGAPHGLAVRTHTVLSHFVASVLTFYLGRNLLGSNRLGVLSALIYNAIPFLSAIAVQNQPDSPLLVFWVATVVCLERALKTERRWWWILAGVCAGGAFLSKFHGFVFVGFILLYLLASKQDRRWARTPWPYLALLTGLLVYSPNIVWNARNEWLTYDFQFLRHGRESHLNIGYPVLTLGAPLIYLSPWVFVLTLAVWRGIYKSGDWIRVRERALLFWITAPLYLFFVLMSLRQQIKFHWAAPAFAVVCPLLAAEIDRWTPRRRAWFLASAAAFSVIVYAYLELSPLTRLIVPPSWLPPVAHYVPGHQKEKDWTNHALGWPEFGAHLRKEVERSGATAPTFILAQRFDRAAVAGFYAEMPERAWVLNPGKDHYLERGDPDPRGFMAWENGLVAEGSNAIYVFYERESRSWKRERYMLLRCFREIDPIELEEYEVVRGGKVVRRFYYVRCTYFLPDAPVVLKDE